MIGGKVELEAPAGGWNADVSLVCDRGAVSSGFLELSVAVCESKS